MRLSIVATLYQTEPHLAEFHARASAVARQFAGDDYEIVLVNDGSPDRSLELAIELGRSDDHLVVVDLSRNFGHHKAMMTGLAHSRGELVFLIDSDLEEDPEYLPAFAEEMQAHACDVVYGVQEVRKGGWFERVSGPLFWRLFNMLAGLDLPENMVTSRLMTRRYVESLLLHREREVLIAGLWHITGYAQRAVKVRKHATSPTTYSFRRKMSLLVNSVTSFSNAPLVGIFYVGVGISLVALGYIGFLVVHWAVLATPLTGWTSVMASIWLLGGMVISFIGVVGIYLSKVFSESKQRPYTIVRRVYSRREE